MICLQQPRGLGRHRAGVLDGLRFVENEIIEPHTPEIRRIVAQCTVGGQDEIVILEMPEASQAQVSGVIKHAQARRETRGLLFPIENQRSGDDGQRRSDARWR